MNNITAVILLSVAIPTVALADARNGEMFGYKIGERYTATNSKLRLHWLGQALEIIADNPEKPEKIQQVVVLASLKSRTILNVRAENEFQANGEARSFALYFSEVFTAQYQIEKWEDPWEKFNDLLNKSEDFPVPDKPRLDGGMSLMARLGKDYELDINVVEAAPDKKKWLVELSLKPRGALRAELEKLAEKEYNELFLEQAKKDKQTKGF